MVILWADISGAKVNGLVPGKIRMFLYEGGTSTEEGGVNNIYASLGDTITIEVYLNNPSQEPVTTLSFYYTVSGKYFDIVQQGNNSDGSFRPFIQGSYMTPANGVLFDPVGNYTHGDLASPYDNGIEGWQLDYIEQSPLIVGQPRPTSNLRYGVACRFQLIAKAICDSATINLDDDHFRGRYSFYIKTNSNDESSFRSFQSCYITVTGASINPPLPDIYMKPASADSSLDLDEYIGMASIPDSLFIWKAAGNNKIGVSIDPATHVVTFTSPADFHGYEDVVFSAGSSKDRTINIADTLRVYVDIPPILKRDAIPDTIYIHEDSLETALYLPGIVNDADNKFEDLKWKFATGKNLTWATIGAKEDTLKLMGVLNFNGIDHLDITVTDDFGLEDSVKGVPVVILPVNDPPHFSGLTDISFERSRPYILNIANYAGDVDGDILVVNYETPQNLTIQINGMVATIRDKNGFIGSEMVRFMVTDPSGLSASDSMNVTVTPLSNPPVWTKIPKIGFPQNQSFSDMILWEYVSDADGEDSQLKFKFSNYAEVDSIYISPTNGRLYLYDLNDKPGWDRITVTATDLDGHEASTQFLVFIGPKDGTPIVAAIPDTSMSAGSTLEWIDLDDYYYDVDNTDAEMKWTASHATADSLVKIRISNVFHVVTLISDKIDIYGTEKLIFTVADPGGKSASDDCLLRVIGKSDPMLDLPNKVGFVTGVKAVIDLNSYVYDQEFKNSLLTWNWSGNVNTIIDYEKEYLQYVKPLYFTSTGGWIGWEKVKFSVVNPFGGGDVDSILVFSVPADGTPVVGGLDSISVKAGSCDSLNIDLDDYFYDADTSEWNITWTASGNDSIQVSIDPTTHVIKFCSPSLTFEGQETITITASDGLHQGSMDVLIKVYGAVLKGVFSMDLYRNPMQSDYMDIYMNSKEILKSLPALRIEVENDTTAVKLKAVADSLNYYYGQYILPYDVSLGLQRNAVVIAYGTTQTNKVVQDTLTFVYGRLGPSGGKLALGDAVFTFPQNSLTEPLTLSLIGKVSEENMTKKISAKTGELTFKGYKYTLGPAGAVFKKPVKVEFNICCRTDGAGIYRLDNDGWEYIGGVISNGKISAETSTSGIFSIGFDRTPPQISEVELDGGISAFKIDDSGSGVDESSINVIADGRKLGFIYNSETASYEIVMDGITDVTEVSFEISVCDMTGNFAKKILNGKIEPRPGQFIVEQNVPNPFNPHTAIMFSVSTPQKVKIEIFDILGRRIKVLTDDFYPAGRHIMEWNASDESGRTVSSGAYFYRVTGENRAVTKKMVFMR